MLAGAGDWATPHRTRLEEVRLGLVEDAMAARVELGAGGEVVAELESLVEQYPLREGLWAALITALYRAGRQAEALSAYARVRRLLADELGVDPGAALQVAAAAGAAAQAASLELQPAAGRDPGQPAAGGDGAHRPGGGRRSGRSALLPCTGW